jgi:hypothetical protein
LKPLARKHVSYLGGTKKALITLCEQDQVKDQHQRAHQLQTLGLMNGIELKTFVQTKKKHQEKIGKDRELGSQQKKLYTYYIYTINLFDATYLFFPINYQNAKTAVGPECAI